LSVIPFRRPEPEVPSEPWIAGEAICIGCQHKWAGTAPVGTWRLDCPTCGSGNGIWMNPIGAQVGDLAFTCICGCEALTAYQRYGKFWLRCMSCGTDQTSAVFGD
jgi:hypothetical protein